MDVKEITPAELHVEQFIAKWKGRGLTEAALQGIRTDVFNVSAPIAP